MGFCISVRSAFGFVRNCIDSLCIALDSIAILTILSSSLWGGLSIYLGLFLSVMFCSDVSFSDTSVYKFCTYLVKFIPRYLIIFDIIVNGIVFLFSLSDSLLLYWNKTNFCMLVCILQFYWIHLLVPIISWWSLKSFLYIPGQLQIMSFTFSFLIWIPLFLFFSNFYS